VVLVRLIAVLIVLGGLLGLVCLLAYVIGQRRGVRSPGVAFIPFVGMTIVLLWSIGRSGWMVLLSFVPFVNFVFAIWLVFALPSYHRRSFLWGFVLLVPVLGMYAYAFTLAWRRSTQVVTTERRDWAWL
jgi:hypothetical protein